MSFKGTGRFKILYFSFAGETSTVSLVLDGVLKCGLTLDELGSLLDKVNSVAGDSVHVVVTVSANEADLPESVKKYL